MKNKTLILIIIFAFAFNNQGNAQVRKADKFYEYYKYSEAIPFYLKAVKSKDIEVKKHSVQRLADCYRFTNNNAEARIWYEESIKYEQTNPMNYFYLGQALRVLELYDKAAKAFETFSVLAPDSTDGKKFYQFCIDIQPWLELPKMAEIKNVESINTKYSDFCPAIYKKGIVFTSDRRLDVLDNNTYGWTNFSYLDLYYTKPEYYKGFWSAMSESESMTGNFNQSYHDGPACFSSDFKKVFITKTETKNGYKDKKRIKTYLLKIFCADIEEGKKLKYKPFIYNSDKYSVAHPTISTDNQSIVFSSDMPGGYGGSDLYICYWVNERLSEPINLGNKINSNGDEVFPYWANDSTLYFSSDGHLGFGGLDIYETHLFNNEWSASENLKKPINSSYDDFGIVFSENGKEGMFSSNRPEGKGADDIYAFRGFKHVEKKVEIPQLIASGYVKELATNNPIYDATVFLLDTETDDILILKSDEVGYYETNVAFDYPYVVKAMKNGFIYDCTTFRTPEANEIVEFSVPRDLLLARLEVNQGFTVDNIYYDLDKWFIRDDAEEPLNNLVQIMKEYPIRAELSSHTDSRASDEYNIELSQKRAESAVRYIILQGISPARLTAKGYGETRLVNNCSDGVDCPEEQHQVNRRTEFKITAIDANLLGRNSFNPDILKAGDIISTKLFDPQFFSNCLVEKEVLKDYLMPAEVRKREP